jgi:hypothetical protein
MLEGDEAREGNDTIITLEESKHMCCMCVCIASGSKNQTELENLCEFIETSPVKKYKKKSA